jgi:chemotaxis protein CheZ
MVSKAKAEKNSEVVSSVEELLVELRKGNDERAGLLLEQVASMWNVSLYQAVGKVTRQLHDSLQDFRNDSRIDALAQEIPDAQQRLQYVINMTQQAADRTLNAVEESLPRCEAMENRAEVLQDAWRRFRKREMNADEFRILSNDIEAFLGETRDSSAQVRSRLNDVLMAQDFQDLTGQVIKKVITLVEEVEAKLVDLIRITGTRLQPDVVEEKVDPIKADGPVIKGVNDKGTVSGQDEVDDLLSSLGF